MQDILTEIIGILTGGITGMATGIGGGLNSLVENIFITTSSTGAQSLSVLGGVVCVFGGVSLAIGLSRLIVKFLTSLGGTRM